MSGPGPSRHKLPEDDFNFIPLDELSAPSGGVYFQHYVRCWWTVHPERGAAFVNRRKANGRRAYGGVGRPQCNSDERIARAVAENGIAWDYEVRFIESAWVPVDISELGG
jgi:hypothetical protein